MRDSNTPRFELVINDHGRQPVRNPNGELVIWDNQEDKPVVTISPAYAQLICFERTDEPDSAPFTTLETWLNSLTNDTLASEGLPITQL